MKFSFETLSKSEYKSGSHLIDFSEMESEQSAALAEGRLLCVFGAPAEVSENYENSFNYYIRATAEDGRAVVLNVYGAGIVSIGADSQDEFALQAANALIEHVNSAAPKDYQRTVYYLDFQIQIDISVKNGQVSVSTSEISEEKALELFNEWYN